MVRISTSCRRELTFESAQIGKSTGKGTGTFSKHPPTSRKQSELAYFPTLLKGGRRGRSYSMVRISTSCRRELNFWSEFQPRAGESSLLNQPRSGKFTRKGGGTSSSHPPGILQPSSSHPPGSRSRVQNFNRVQARANFYVILSISCTREVIFESAWSDFQPRASEGSEFQPRAGESSKLGPFFNLVQTRAHF